MGEEQMKPLRNLVTIFILLAFVLSGMVLAKPVNKADAEKMVTGWLRTDPKPLNTIVGGQVEATDVFTDENGAPVYYIVYLNPTGFVVVAADDLAEPVVAFVSGDAFYDPSPENPLGALISRDLPGRVAYARNLQKELDSGKVKAMADEAVKVKDKWSKLKAGADEPRLPMLGSISDVRVAALVQSKWNQGEIAGSPCYNYYTPNNYVCGCVATAMAQVVRYFQYQPAGGIGVHTFQITVNGSPQNANTRGGNGSGGAYNWTDMVLVPGSGITTAQRQQIGALTYDCGVTVNMGYSAGGSGAYQHNVRTALKTIYGYSNALITYHDWYGKDAGMLGMINPNLDAGYPILFSVWDQGNAEHSIVCDGYGYNGSTMYHHINMGWGGSDDAWYNIPDISYFSVIDSITYNVYTSGTGEIISGRVTSSSGEPVNGATVTATGPGGPYTRTTNSQGIYAFAKVQANSTYTISVTATNCTFTNQNVTTGTSVEGQLTSGNKWAIDFAGTCIVPPPPTPPSITYPTSSSSWDFQISWGSATGATSYQVERSSNGGGSWGQVFSGSGLSFMDHAGNGSYRYRVKASNSGGSSGWCTGTYDCVVTVAPPPAFSESADFYVDGPSGSDLNAGTSSQPWKTLANASEVAPGQKVLVWGNQTYTGTTTFLRSGTSASPITIKHDPASGEAVLNGGATSQAVINSTEAAYIVIDGFKLTNGKHGVFLDSDVCDGWIIKNCKVTANTTNGLYIRNGDDNLFFNNMIYLNDSGNNGVQISNSAVNNDIVQCSIHKQKFGVYISASSTGGEIRDCIIANNTTYGVRLYNNAAVTVSYTDCWGNGTNYSGNGFTHGAGEISANPLWVNPDAGDFHLQGGSPCDNTGSDGGDMGYRYGAEPPAPPGQAGNPSPAAGATNVATDADLSWTAGTGATSHDVYFGTTSPGTFQGNQTGTTFDTGTMANSTTYYWRIDAKNAQGTTTGVVWSFTTTSGGTTITLYCPAAEDGYMRESTETSNVGGFVSASNALRVGDTNAKLQQIGVISFDTSTIPDGATITSATVSVARTGVTGDPSVLGSLVA